MQQITDSLSPAMIFYPENPVRTGENQSRASARGTVGHEVMFMVMLNILEGCIQNNWTQAAELGRPLFGDHTPMLLALMDAGIAQNMNETHRAKSSTLCESEMRLNPQISDLKRR